jgi:hypothetical protein
MIDCMSKIKKRMNKPFFFIIHCILLFFGVSLKTFSQNTFPHPDRICYDQDCFTIEKEDIFIFSAAFHYFRVPEELWRDRFQKIKDAGFNTVETYVPWNWHEKDSPRDIKDFSQCNFNDLKAWLKMAHEEFGLYTIVRPGPFICAEWAGGAYPRWLAKYCPNKYETSFWLRSDHPEHLKWARHWYDAVIPIFAAEQITRKNKGEKGIIMVQLENEYIYFDMASSKKEKVLRELAQACTDNGIEVPLFTCMTPEVRGSKKEGINQLFDMDNQYVWWNLHEAKRRIEKLKQQQQDAPAFVCELQGGWFSTQGGRLSEDSYLDGRHARGIALMNLAGGATGLNYYMFFGGTHFAGWGARRMTTSYDYGAPLKENGGVGEKYAAVKGIGEIVDKFGKQLVRSKSVCFQLSAPEEQLEIGVRKATDGTLFVFLLNKDRKNAFKKNISLVLDGGETLSIYCSLNSLDSKMLVLSGLKEQGEWYPKEQPLPKRPSNLPGAIRIAKAKKYNETFRGNWQKIGRHASLPELGVSDCRYSMYRSTVSLSNTEVKKMGSFICHTFTADPVYLQVNGKLAKRASSDELDNTFLLQNLLHPGKNELIVIYENRGHAHGYRPMEELSGVKEAGVGEHQSEIVPIEEWEVKDITGRKADIRQELQKEENWEKIVLDQSTIANLATLQIAGLSKPKWSAAWILQEKKGTAIYRTFLQFTPEMIKEGKSILEFACVDDAGTLWINGKEVASHNAWDKPFVVNIAPFIHQGKNEIAIVVNNKSGAGGLLKGVRLLKELKIIKPLNWEVSKDLGGIAQGVTEGKNADEIWSEVTLKTEGTLIRKGIIPTKGIRDALLTWYKVTFKLPELEKEVWVPWRAIINASGTGYMWLNGHNIGRYWEEGPQREFYLPECWLNFGEENTLILGLRQSEWKGSVLEGVEIAPYYEDAEIKSHL